MRKTVYVCIGVAGVGKDTYISSRLNDKTVHISSNETRLKLFGTLDCQTGKCRNKVCEDMRDKLKAFLLDDEHEVAYYNATNLRRKSRRGTYDLIRSLDSNAKVVALVFLKSLNTILEQNGKRPVDKVVPSDKVVTMYKNLQVPRIGVDCDKIKLANGNNFEDFRHEFAEDIPHDNPFHLETVYEHIEMVSRLAEERKDWISLEVAKYHDLGKFICREYNEKKGYHTYNNHANVSAMYYLASLGDFEYEDVSDSKMIILETIFQHMNKGDFSEKMIKNNKLTAVVVRAIKHFNEIDNLGRMNGTKVFVESFQIAEEADNILSVKKATNNLVRD